MKTKIFLIALISAVMFSCSEEEIDRSDNKEKKSEIQVTNNLVVFPNEESLVSALNNDLPDPIKASFKSQRSIFDTLTEREYRRALFLRNLSDEEYYKVDRHCDYYRELLKTNFIKETNLDDGTQLYQLNLCMPTYSNVLNEDGFFAIGDTIYQITPNQYKIWKNGDINNYQELIEITETDLSKNIYVYNFNDSQNAIKTRSLFPLYNIDQEVAYYTYYDPTLSNNPANGTCRGILTFYDKTGLSIPNYTRNIYVRISYQEKTDGRNYSFKRVGYELESWFDTYVDKKPAPKMELYANGTSQDVWYTVYFPYGMLVEGQQTQTAGDQYWNIVEYYLRVYFKGEKVKSTAFKGKRQEPLSGTFYYTPFDGALRLTEMLPE